MKDQNFTSIVGRQGESIVLGHLTPPEGYADTLKVTACSDLAIVAGHIIGGREDCVDINNRCSHIVVTADLFEPKGQYLSTIKGGSSNITLRGYVKGHGSVVDIDIGNVSDQSDNLTGPVYLDLEHVDGDVITVRCLGGPRPIFLNADTQRYKVVLAVPTSFLQSWFLKGYKLLKRLGLPI